MGGQNSTSKHSKEDSSNIVDLVISGRFLSSLENKDSEEKLIEINEVDHEQPLKDIATDFVVKEFFKSESSLYSFMFTTYNYFIAVLEEYRDKRRLTENELIFLYKGGNILRIVSKEFWLELPANTTRELIKLYTPYFKRSDSDFAIYIDPNIKDYDKIYNEIGLISYLVLFNLRKIFLSDLHDFFDYFKYNDNFKRSLLETYLHKLNGVEGFNFTGLSIGDVSTSKYTGNINNNKSDTAIFKKSKNTSEKVSVFNSNSFFVNSYNNTLEFDRNSDKGILSKFTLVRTKIDLSLSTPSGGVNSIGGELIDVSISHRDDTGVKYFFEHVNIFKTSYELSYMNEKLSITGYTLDYLIYDLEGILFKEHYFPWENKKYYKRLYRLFYMYFVDIFINVLDRDVRFDIFKDFQTMILDTYKNSKINILKQSNIFSKKYDNFGIKIIDIVHALYDLCIKVKFVDDINKFEEFINILIENNKFILKTTDNIIEYCEYDGVIENEDIYTTTSKVLL